MKKKTTFGLATNCVHAGGKHDEHGGIFILLILAVVADNYRLKLLLTMNE